MKSHCNLQKQTKNNLQSLENIFHELSVKRETLPEMLMFQQQSDLIKQITDLSKNRKNNTISTELSDMSINLSQSSRAFNCSISGFNSFRNQNRQSFEQELDEALSEVRSQCSKKVYRTIRSFLSRKSQKENIGSQNILQRQKKQSQESLATIKKLNKENVELKAKVKKLQEQLILYEQEKKRKEKNVKVNIEKEHRIVKFQIGLLSKEKMHAEMKKNLNKQQKRLREQQQNNQKFKQYLLETINEISNMKGVRNCEGNCWRANIITQCMNNLKKQREILQIQQQQTQEHYLEIREIVEQLKSSIN